MPNLFGLALADAQAQLGAAGLSLSRILDSHGNDIAPAAVPAEIKTARVLNQVPEAGLPVQAKDAVQLQVSAKVEVKLPVKVPKLLGMTYAQAQAALDAVGLKLAAPINGTK
jgi:beta-lactam-binding protein with PASTA domain